MIGILNDCSKILKRLDQFSKKAKEDVNQKINNLILILLDLPSKKKTSTYKNLTTNECILELELDQRDRVVQQLTKNKDYLINHFDEFTIEQRLNLVKKNQTLSNELNCLDDRIVNATKINYEGWLLFCLNYNQIFKHLFFLKS